MYTPSKTYSHFHLDKPQIPVGVVRERPLRYGLPISYSAAVATVVQS